MRGKGQKDTRLYELHFVDPPQTLELDSTQYSIGFRKCLKLYFFLKNLYVLWTKAALRGWRKWWTQYSKGLWKLLGYNQLWSQFLAV